uniref:Uncharacterized protein n=1 Tax=Rhizophora mucronata TaxID=61149 RepID=A0A2P2QAQ9_RHIMU
MHCSIFPDALVFCRINIFDFHIVHF